MSRPDAASAALSASPKLLDVFDLDEADGDVYVSRLVYPDDQAVYGGQVAAQALVAAGRTVPAGRIPHSLHLYYLRGGDAAQPMEFRVDRDRDGRAFYARRVAVVQDGRLIATAACSFTVQADGIDVQLAGPPVVVAEPGDLPLYPTPRLFGFECRLPIVEAPRAWPTRFWARVVEPMPADRLIQAATVVYLSDKSSGVGGLDVSEKLIPISLDHAVWLHRPVHPEDWVLVDLVPHTVAAERTWYTGTLHDPAGVLLASVAQEVLTRPA